MSALKCQNCAHVERDPIVVTRCPSCGVTGGMRAYTVCDIIDVIRADLREAREAEAALFAELRDDIRAAQAAIDRFCEPVPVNGEWEIGQ